MSERLVWGETVRDTATLYRVSSRQKSSDEVQQPHRLANTNERPLNFKIECIRSKRHFQTLALSQFLSSFCEKNSMRKATIQNTLCPLDGPAKNRTFVFKSRNNNIIKQCKDKGHQTMMAYLHYLSYCPLRAAFRPQWHSRRCSECPTSALNAEPNYSAISKQRVCMNLCFFVSQIQCASNESNEKLSIFFAIE